jgi:hypothetical protein
MFKRWAAAIGGVVLMSATTVPAWAGEVTGTGKPTAAPDHAASICAFSGLNDEPESETEGGRVQSYGQLVQSGAINPLFFNPGDACQGN